MCVCVPASLALIKTIPPESFFSLSPLRYFAYLSFFRSLDWRIFSFSVRFFTLVSLSLGRYLVGLTDWGRGVFCEPGWRLKGREEGPRPVGGVLRGGKRAHFLHRAAAFRLFQHYFHVFSPPRPAFVHKKTCTFIRAK